MINRAPAWFTKAREFAARAGSPVPFKAAKRDKTTKLYLYDAIGKDGWTGEGISAQDVVTALAEVKAGDTLEVHVNSPGGQVFEGIAIYNALKSHDGPKVVYVDGVAASIASIIALAGDTVVTGEGATWMIHDPMGGVFSFGTADQIEDDAGKTVKALRKIREQLLAIYADSTGSSLSDISTWMSAETWMSAAEAKARGFTDEIMKPDPEQEEEMAAVTRPAASLSASAGVALARARVKALAEQFPGVRPGSAAGPPATTAGNPKKEKKP